MFHKRPGQAVSNDHALLAQLAESSSLMGKSHCGLSAVLLLSMSMETISMAFGSSFFVLGLELMIVSTIFLNQFVVKLKVFTITMIHYQWCVRVVQKCTKYMISNKSNLQHVTFGIKIHVVGCFDPLRPSGLS